MLMLRFLQFLGAKRRQLPKKSAPGDSLRSNTHILTIIFKNIAAKPVLTEIKVVIRTTKLQIIPAVKPKAFGFKGIFHHSLLIIIPYYTYMFAFYKNELSHPFK
jgi:hypothetical protein